MRTTKLLFVFVLFLISSFSLSAQVFVSVNNTITQDTLLSTVQKSSIISKTVNASGIAEFYSNSGYVRILLSDDYGYDLLVYESFPLVAVNGIDNFSNISIEAFDISFDLTKIRVEIKNAELRNLSVDISTKSPSRSKQQQARVDRVALMNNNLRNQNALWVAGETDVSRMTYQEKKGLFGGKVPDLQGFEYYVGGIFELNSDEVTTAHKSSTPKTANYVSSFDWRNRHGANNPASPYYNSSAHGWVTSVKNQNSCGACGVFAVIGTIEALTNLYYNRFLNKDLSEQDIVSCMPNGGSCKTGWLPESIIDHIRVNGVAEEACFPYAATDLPCSNKCSNPTENIKVNGRINCETGAFPKTIEAIKHNVIKYGPISGGVYSLSHAMSMIGWKEIQSGDDIYLGSMYSHITIPPNDSRIGQTAWLFKNSWGTTWGNQGFGYMLLSNISDIKWTHVILTPIISPNYTNTNIVCEDRDGDGYYFWGIGPKPAHCPTCAPDEPDGDDSNPNLGPMDEYGNCASITPLVENITTTQTWSANKILCKNIAVQSGVTLTIASTATVLSSNHTITIKNGGKLILSGGTIDDGYVIAQSGSELTISNNGKILLGNYDNLDVQLGATFNLEYGEVLLK